MTSLRLFLLILTVVLLFESFSAHWIGGFGRLGGFGFGRGFYGRGFYGRGFYGRPFLGPVIRPPFIYPPPLIYPPPPFYG
ncbi:neuropeptide-like protein 30 [Pieris rapae]|uniref:neuropeptide-like protein 30 n=1 Tax=Pieris rapae TaxID=64459 RepID=UPI001E28079F|nr:neuropeptide-like protein 30 [Pieris rapae]